MTTDDAALRKVKDIERSFYEGRYPTRELLVPPFVWLLHEVMLMQERRSAESVDHAAVTDEMVTLALNEQYRQPKFTARQEHEAMRAALEAALKAQSASAVDRDAVIEECAVLIEKQATNAAYAFNNSFPQISANNTATATAINFYNRAARLIRALKSAAPTRGEK